MYYSLPVRTELTTSAKIDIVGVGRCNPTTTQSWGDVVVVIVW